MRRENQGNPGVITSDESLVALARCGDRNAFAELWQRHAASGLRVARQFTSASDADDLVSEAYARIYQRVLAGGGPEGTFRPYLYTTIRNLASRWGETRRDVNVDDIGDFEHPETPPDPVSVALDRTLTVRAFRSLPDRWQSVLWYTEVEGMDPHEVAPLLGISANSVAALSYRAREGLRKAWLQAHVSDAVRSGECQWAITRLGDYARNGLTTRETVRVSDHLATCTKCLIISEEVDEVGSRLALVMLPLLLGGVAGGTLLASLGAPSSALAASSTLSVAMPPAFGALGSVGALTVPAVAAGLSLPALSAPLLVTLAIACAVSGGMALADPNQPANQPASSSLASPVAEFIAAAPPSSWPTGRDDLPRPIDPTATLAPPLTDALHAPLTPTSAADVTDQVSALTIPALTTPTFTIPTFPTPLGTTPSLTLPSLTLPSLTLPPLAPLKPAETNMPGPKTPHTRSDLTARTPIVPTPTVPRSFLPGTDPTNTRSNSALTN